MTDLGKNETVEPQESQTVESQESQVNTEEWTPGNELKEYKPEEKINPWLTIWLKPRKTIRYIINTNPTQYVIILSMVSGFFTSLDRASSKNMGDDFPLWGIIAIALFLGTIGGVISLYICSALIRWTGSWMHGQANTEQIRAAMAWSYLPTIYGSILWIPELAIYRKEMFTRYTPTMDSSTFLSNMLLAFNAIEVTCAIWSMIVFYKCLEEVQGFSAWRAFGNCINAFLVVFVPIIVFVMIATSLL